MEGIGAFGHGLIDVEELQNAAFSLGIPMDNNIKKLLAVDEKITFDVFYNKMTAKLCSSTPVGPDHLGV